MARTLHQRQTDADRRQAEDDGHHRPAQHADAEYGDQGDRELKVTLTRGWNSVILNGPVPDGALANSVHEPVFWNCAGLEKKR
jgi:hypothetical protein